MAREAFAGDTAKRSSVPTRVAVTVKPGSRADSIASVPGGLVVRVHARAHDGLANVACIRALAEYFGVPVSRVILVHGAHSRQKVFNIED